MGPRLNYRDVSHRAIQESFARGCALDAEKARRRSSSRFIAPVFFVLLMGTFEAAIMFFSQTVLQNAMNDMGRMIRTGQVNCYNKTGRQLRIGYEPGAVPHPALRKGLGADPMRRQSADRCREARRLLATLSRHPADHRCRHRHDDAGPERSEPQPLSDRPGL